MAAQDKRGSTVFVGDDVSVSAPLKIHEKPLEDVIAELQTHADNGLSSAEAAKRLEEDGQNLSEEVKNEFGLVRAPPVGDGKTNVHFDEYESPEHGAMERLARQSRFEDIVSSYIGRPCTLYEAGASITTPGGEGMEWHRDGTEGEVTVLMSLSNVEADQGQLGVIPRSHKGAKLEKLKDEELTAADDDKAVWYSYRAGCPMIIDARTQHSVRDNVSQDKRCILWYIYN